MKSNGGVIFLLRIARLEHPGPALKVDCTSLKRLRDLTRRF
jgi:hypothetical protein